MLHARLMFAALAVGGGTGGCTDGVLENAGCFEVHKHNVTGLCGVDCVVRRALRLWD